MWSAKIDVRSRTLCATASGDFTAKLWCVSTGKELHELKHKHIVRSVDFSSDTEMLCSGCHDGVIRIFQTARLEAPPTERISPTSPREVIMKVLWLDENRILVGRKSGLLEAVDRRVDGVVQSLQMAGGGSIMDMELNAAHNTILIASGKTVSFHSIDSIDMQKSFTMPEGMHFQEEGGASLHPKGHLFMAGASDLWLREFDSNSGEVLNTFKGHHGKQSSDFFGTLAIRLSSF